MTAKTQAGARLRRSGTQRGTTVPAGFEIVAAAPDVLVDSGGRRVAVVRDRPG
jgi:hypothetical protein